MNTTDKKCRTCFFGYPLDGGEKFKCHAKQPHMTRGTFPTVNEYDYCSFWTDEKTLDRPLSYVKYCNTLKETMVNDANGDEERGE